MRYRIKKETKPTLPTYGKYKAVAVHDQTIDSRQIAEEATRGMTISAGVLEGILMNVAEVVRRHLRNGDKVRLKDIGLLKLEIESEKVDNLKDFRAKKHIRGVRLHLIPESYEGSQELYNRESNSELSFRRALLYPFNYQGRVLFGCKGKAFFAESQTNVQ